MKQHKPGCLILAFFSITAPSTQRLLSSDPETPIDPGAPSKGIINGSILSSIGSVILGIGSWSCHMSIRTQLRASVAAPSVGQVPLKNMDTETKSTNGLRNVLWCELHTHYSWCANAATNDAARHERHVCFHVAELCRVEFCQKKPFKSLCL